VSKFSDQFAAAPVLKPSVVVVVVPKLFRSSLLPSFLIRTAHVVAWLPAVATLQPLPLLLLLATVACCCCWVLFLFLFVCWSVLLGLCIFVLREEEGLQERKKERKKEERVAYSVVVVVAC
jgi:hypothetical protein